MSQFIYKHLGIVFLFALVTALTGVGCDGCGNGKSTSDAGTDGGLVDAGIDTGCTPGTLNCACGAGDSCDGTLVCIGGICTTKDATTEVVSIGNPLARACEFLFQQGDGRLDSAEYGDSTKGALRRRDPNVAIAVSRADDTPFAADSLSLSFIGDSGGVTLESSRCFDAAGAEVDGLVSF